MKTYFITLLIPIFIGCQPPQATRQDIRFVDISHEPSSSTSDIVLGSIAKQHQSDGKKLIDVAMSDTAGFLRLGEMCETFGPRISGSENLENAIDWILSEMEKDGLENVHGEHVMVPKWVRGNESAQMIAPWKKDMAMLGLGGSIGTPPSGITAEVMVVGSFDELTERANEAKLPTTITSAVIPDGGVPILPPSPSMAISFFQGAII
jgi:carboxypeptidase Q